MPDGSWTQNVAIGLTALTAVGSLILNLRLHFKVEEQSKRLRIGELFDGFGRFTQGLMAHPGAFRALHNELADVEDDDELRAIAALGMLIDGYERDYTPTSRSDKHRQKAYARMVLDARTKPHFLCAMLRDRENQRRWVVLKALWYDEFDKPLTDAIDRIIENENERHLAERVAAASSS